MTDQKTESADDRGPEVGFGRFKISLPQSRSLRILIGIGLCLGGMMWFLPVLGIWMLPLGIIVLAVDVPFFRPLRDRFYRWWERWSAKHGGADS
ncbi:MAG: hypothetical protein GC166_04990 [Alphaproteobacteria bacterium]|nr:hypothetical protein [Alphaproteobacteria bacterium]